MSVLVGKPAPDFSAQAVINGDEIVENFTLSQFKGKNEVVLFFWPLDFTFVCPTEIIAFQDALGEFEKRGVKVVGVSVDSANTHLAWLSTPKNKGGIQGVTYPVVSDITKTISMNYDVLAGEYDYDVDDNGREFATFSGAAIAYRGTFLIDKNGIVRHQVVNDLPLGRNIHETLRMVDALQYFEKNGEVCPANWEEGQKGLQTNLEAVGEYLSGK
jgi:peroxiredoxin (alkyl hydroperoxide reductase subunit C)